MTTGSINYLFDNKVEEPNPLNVIFEQGMERQRLSAERARLERAVLDAVIEKHNAEQAAYSGGNTIKRTSALVRAVEAGKAAKDAVQSLIDFESKQEK